MARDAASSLKLLALPASGEAALAQLTEPVRQWFGREFGVPTAAQRFAWPILAAGENLLLSSPTGSGKTLAAFAPILACLLSEPYVGTRCLYATPLKSLGNDVRKNLRRYLRGIADGMLSRPELAAEGPGNSRRENMAPAGRRRVRVGIRTGDTANRVRRKLVAQPPDILITTPESLAVLLANPAALVCFQDLRWVIVDEVHALAANKRGADLALSLERLEATVHQAPLQRIGLSATCAPLPTLARFLVGTNRPCSIAAVADSTPLHLRIEPLPVSESEESASFMARLLARLEPELHASRTTLIFTNARGLAERLTFALRRRLPEWAEQIAVHHSSLAAVRRRLVERRLKQGKLRVAVSSTSLELGVDIGSVDQVILVHPPGGVVRLLQRVGRSGHQPQQTRRGLVLTDSPGALLEATVTGASGRASQIEPLKIPNHPLDVLCQHLLGLAVQGWCSADEAFALVTRAYPYQELARADFDSCLDYLSGRHRDGRAWLPARLRWEEDRFSVLDQRTVRLLRRNSGTIVAPEHRSVRLQEADDTEEFGRAPLLGEVDELFADHLQPGDRFVLDGRCLEYQQKDGAALLVSEVVGRPQTPRWPGSGWPLSPGLAQRLFLFRVQAAEALRDGRASLERLLQHDFGLEPGASSLLADLFELQETVSAIPDQATCLIECVRTFVGAEYYVHTPLNRAGNDALARVAGLRLTRDLGLRSTGMAADLGLMLSVQARHDLTPRHWRDLLSSVNFELDLDAAIADSMTLRECFRRTALIGLMLLRNPLGRRRRVGGHDWAERRLFDQVQAIDAEFVLLRQARADMAENCDAATAQTFVEALSRLIVHCRWLSRVSPFAENWNQPALTLPEPPTPPAEALADLAKSLVLA